MNNPLFSQTIGVLFIVGPIVLLLSQSIINSWKDEDEHTSRNALTDFSEEIGMPLEHANIVELLRRCGVEVRSIPDRVTGMKHCQVFFMGIYLAAWVCVMSGLALDKYVEIARLSRDAALGSDWFLGTAIAMAIIVFLGMVVILSMYNVFPALKPVFIPTEILKRPKDSYEKTRKSK